MKRIVFFLLFLIFIGGKCEKQETPKPLTNIDNDTLIIDTLRQFDIQETIYIHYAECVNIYSNDSFLFKLCFDDIEDKRCSSCLPYVDCFEPTYATLFLKIFTQDSLLGTIHPKVLACNSGKLCDSLAGYAFCVFPLYPQFRRAPSKSQYSIKINIH